MNAVGLVQNTELGPLVEAANAEGFNFMARLQLEPTANEFTGRHCHVLHLRTTTSDAASLDDRLGFSGCTDSYTDLSATHYPTLK